MFTGENAVQSKLLYRGYQLEVRRAPSGGALDSPSRGACYVALEISGSGGPGLVLILQIIKRGRQTRCCGFGQILGAFHHIDAEALGKTINGHLQLAASTDIVEKAGLGMIIAADEIVCDETNQAERPAVIDMFEEIDG
jgi:hypothetical protein